MSDNLKQKRNAGVCDGSRLSRIKVLLLMVLVLGLMTGCGTSKGHRKHKSGKIAHTEIVIPSGLTRDRELLVKEAETWIGAPYRYAGSDKKEGTDCSGMVLRIYEDVLGIKLPRNSAKQAEFCRKLKKGKVRSGDLVFFATGKDPDRISHVGIMVNDEDFIHASTSKGVVISKVTTPYYQRVFMMYGRPPGID